MDVIISDLMRNRRIIMECPRCGSMMEGGICNNCGFPVTKSMDSVFGLCKPCVSQNSFKNTMLRYKNTIGGKRI